MFLREAARATIRHRAPLPSSERVMRLHTASSRDEIAALLHPRYPRKMELADRVSSQ